MDISLRLNHRLTTAISSPHDGNPNNITKKQIVAKQADLKKAYDALEYQRLRKPLYPRLEDVTVALAEKAEGDSTMWDAISKKRADVKKAHPKT